MAHLAFLGVGPDLPAAMAPMALLIAVLVWPLAPRLDRRGLAAVLMLATLSLGLAASVRFDPPAVSIPTYRR